MELVFLRALLRWARRSSGGARSHRGVEVWARGRWGLLGVFAWSLWTVNQHFSCHLVNLSYTQTTTEIFRFNSLPFQTVLFTKFNQLLWHPEGYIGPQ